MSTNIKNNLITFSRGWEGFVDFCIKNTKKDNPTVSFFSNHEVPNLIKDSVLPDLKSLIDTSIYSASYSFGKGGLTGTPWFGVFDKRLTTSAQNEYYIVYLFSRNAKKLYLTFALGANQFTKEYGLNSTATKRINDAKKKFTKYFEEYSPIENFDEMDLLVSSDVNFIRKNTKKIERSANNYIAGSFFTKSYDLVNLNFTEEEFINDLNKYIECYKAIYESPISSLIIKNLPLSVIKESDIKKPKYDYPIPEFIPEIIKKSEGKTKTKPDKKNVYKSRSPDPETSNVKIGIKGEDYVYEFEKIKLQKANRYDLAEKIVMQCRDHSYFPGYDIQSFDENGDKIYIEVKSTNQKAKKYFEISENEIKAAEELGTSYYIYQVINVMRDPKISYRINDIFKKVGSNQLLIEPLIHRITFKN